MVMGSDELEDDHLYEESDDDDSCWIGSTSEFGGEEEDNDVSNYGNSGDSAGDVRDRENSRPDFAVLSESDIRRFQNSDISEISDLLSLSSDSATALLLHHGWNAGRAQDAWFSDEDAVRRALGFATDPVPAGGAAAAEDWNSTFFCRICLEYHAIAAGSATAGCFHLFCNECWKGYIGVAIADGSGCLTLRCPDPACRAAVGREMAENFATDDDRKKYSQYILRSFVESKRDVKWCSAPGCDFAVQFFSAAAGGGAGRYVVRCNCSNEFCWSCLEESHSPLDCETVAKWVLKNGCESENTQWIIAYCKPCPKCRRNIEKNQGCMHMICSDPCKHHFCWLCLSDWSTHDQSTGGYYACNVYEKQKRDGVVFRTEERRKMAAASLEMYTHYFERWATNGDSRHKALEEVAVLGEKFDRLIAVHGQSAGQLTVVTEAWLQIAECRRVLKWSYAYGYYLSEIMSEKKEFFEYLQGEAEWGLDQLHKCAEREMEVFVEADKPMVEEFEKCREKLAHLTAVTKKYFENLIPALEGGLGGPSLECAADRSNSSLEIQPDV